MSSSTQPEPNASPPRAERLLRRIADASCFALLVLAPLLAGGAYPIGRFVFVALICLLSLTWIWGHYVGRRRVWQVTGLEWLLISAGSAIVFQLLPLPHRWLAALSPAIAERLPLWTTSGSVNLGLGSWSSISLHPDATRGGLALLVAYALLFLVTAQRMTDQQAVARTLRWVAAGAMLMALFGLVQYLAGDGRVLWNGAQSTRPMAGMVHGAFANQNHMAHMLALGIGPLLWWLSCLKAPVPDVLRQLLDRKKPRTGHADGCLSATKQRGQSTTTSGACERRGKFRTLACNGWRRAALGTGLSMVLLAGLLTWSRAGILAILLSAAFVVAIMIWTRTLSWRGGTIAGAACLLLVVALPFNGYDRLASRVVGSVGGESTREVAADRELVWLAVQRAVTDFPILGSGVGTHRDVYPLFLEQPQDVEFTYVECGYLQVLEELGVVGLSLLLVTIGVVGNWCRLALIHAPTGQIRLLAGVVTASLLVSALHSLVDFVWFIPACMTITTVLAACAWRLSQLALYGVPAGAPHGAGVPRSLFLAGSLGASVTAMVIVMLSLGPARAASHWERFARLTDADVSEKTSTREPIKQATSGARLERMIACLRRVLQADPRDARAHVRMAALCIQKFNLAQRQSRHAMNLGEIRGAALASEFPSLRAQNRWLAQAVPENRILLDEALRHARQAARLSPLQGEPYVYLAQLGFLHGDGRRAKWAYLEQALHVRPHNDDVLMAAGSELALEGDLRQATACWRPVFHRNPRYQSQIIAMIAPQVSADAFLKAYQPDAAGARLLFEHYRQLGFMPQATVAGRYYVAQLDAIADQQAGGLNVDQCLEAYEVQDYLGNDVAALDTLRHAVKQDSQHYVVRQKLAQHLLRLNQYAEARQHLQWCLRRQPHDLILGRALETATHATPAPLRR